MDTPSFAAGLVVGAVIAGGLAGWIVSAAAARVDTLTDSLARALEECRKLRGLVSHYEREWRAAIRSKSL